MFNIKRFPVLFFKIKYFLCFFGVNTILHEPINRADVTKNASERTKIGRIYKNMWQCNIYIFFRSGDFHPTLLTPAQNGNQLTNCSV